MGERKISTFVFLDCEATGLPDSRTRMTELSLVAAHREVIIFVFFFFYMHNIVIFLTQSILLLPLTTFMIQLNHVSLVDFALHVLGTGVSLQKETTTCSQQAYYMLLS